MTALYRGLEASFERSQTLHDDTHLHEGFNGFIERPFNSDTHEGFNGFIEQFNGYTNYTVIRLYENVTVFKR